MRALALTCALIFGACGGGSKQEAADAGAPDAAAAAPDAGPCGPGEQRSGETCEDIDGCAAEPCFSGVECTDVPAPGDGRLCGPCPAGLWGDGISCRRRLDFGRRIVPVREAPNSLAAGDLNGDGIDDLVVANGGVGNVFVLLAGGGGAFDAVDALAPAEGQPALGDLDGDGRLDVVVARDAVTLAIHAGDGAGGFADPALASVPAAPTDLALADIDGDGRLDAVASQESGAVVTLLGDGEGDLGDPLSSSMSGSADHLAVADFDGDGQLDVAVAGTSGVTVALGDGDGRFSGAPAFGLNDQSAGDLIAADWNGDGWPDLAVTAGSEILVASNDGAGGFGPPSGLDAGAGATALAPGDFDRDGLLDMAVIDIFAEESCVYFGDGGGGFPRDECVSSGPTPLALAAGDLDGAIGRDLAVTNVTEDGLDTVTLLLGDGDGGFPDQSVEVQTSVNVYGLAAADFDEDGVLDLVGNSAGGAIAVHEGDGERGFTKLDDHDVADRPVAIIAADFDGDGHADVATASDGVAEVDVLLGDGTGALGPYEAHPVTSGVWALAAADLDGDGDVDLVSANAASDDLSVLIDDGDGGMLRSDIELIARPTDVAAADLDGDGLPELIALSEDTLDRVIVVPNLGGGSFGEPDPIALGIDAAAVSQVVPADLDGDGNLDLVVSGWNELAVLLGDGGGGFSIETVPTPFMHVHLAAADFDGDGRIDVAATTWTSSDSIDATTVFPGDGSGDLVLPPHHFAPVVDQFAVGGGALIARDLDGDGSPDLAWGGVDRLQVMFN